MVQLKVVIHADEMERWTMTLSNLQNLIKDHPNAQVCANSMRHHGLDPAVLPDFARLVPAGISALIENQQEGFAYVKP